MTADTTPEALRALAAEALLQETKRRCLRSLTPSYYREDDTLATISPGRRDQFLADADAMLKAIAPGLAKREAARAETGDLREAVLRHFLGQGQHPASAALNTDAILSLLSPAIAAAEARGIERAVPDGWKLVPVEPTFEMVDAGYEATRDENGDPKFYDCGFLLGHSLTIYRAMLSASPRPDTQAKEGVGQDWSLSDQTKEGLREIDENQRHARTNANFVFASPTPETGK